MKVLTIAVVACWVMGLGSGCSQIGCQRGPAPTGEAILHAVPLAGDSMKVTLDSGDVVIWQARVRNYLVDDRVGDHPLLQVFELGNGNNSYLVYVRDEAQQRRVFPFLWR